MVDTSREKNVRHNLGTRWRKRILMKRNDQILIGEKFFLTSCSFSVVFWIRIGLGPWVLIGKQQQNCKLWLFFSIFQGRSHDLSQERTRLESARIQIWVRIQQFRIQIRDSNHFFTQDSDLWFDSSIWARICQHHGLHYRPWY